ncbi:hypothetical protein YWY31_33060 [Paenibacillus illinoisensis]
MPWLSTNSMVIPPLMYVRDDDPLCSVASANQNSSSIVIELSIGHKGIEAGNGWCRQIRIDP